MWTYNSRNGQLLHNSIIIGKGYSGIHQGLNNEADDNLQNVGPIPVGLWTIGTFFNDLPPVPSDGLSNKGAIVAHLTPNANTNTFGRSGFMIHGDNAAANFSASHGCIILGRPFRQAIAASGDTVLNVI